MRVDNEEESETERESSYFLNLLMDKAKLICVTYILFVVIIWFAIAATNNSSFDGALSPAGSDPTHDNTNT